MIVFSWCGFFLLASFGYIFGEFIFLIMQLSWHVFRILQKSFKWGVKRF